MKLKSLLVALVLLLPSVGAAQSVPRPVGTILDDLTTTAARTVADVAELKLALSSTVVPAGGDLRAALAKGGVIHLDAAGTYTGNFTLTSNTTLLCHGAVLAGSAGAPAVAAEPNTDNLKMSQCQVSSAYDQQAIRIGRNDSSQTTIGSAPAHIELDRIGIPTYRGKHAIEINAADVKITNSVINDVYDNPTSSRDSQAIWIGNAPCAPCVISGNNLSAGSENILIGGDTMKILDANGVRIVPTDITITNNDIWKPLTWQTDGINRAVKNLIELKAGIRVYMANNRLDGSWHAAQDGYCFVVTPRNMAEIRDVLIENNSCTHVGGGINILGVNDSTWTPAPISNLVVKNNRFDIDHRLYGGRGILALLTNAPHDVTFDGNIVKSTGNCIVYLDKPGSHLLVDGVTREPNLPMAVLTITNNFAVAGAYGIIIGGANRDTPLVTVGIVDQLNVTGNTVADANNWMKKYFPTNTYLARVDWDALVATK